MHFHLTRRDVLNEIKQRFGYNAEQANSIAGFLEDSGQIEFSGAMFLIKNPTDQDALQIMQLAHAAQGKGAGGAVSQYKTKEYLDFLLRESGRYGKKRGLSS
jgi:hypothetical protein